MSPQEIQFAVPKVPSLTLGDVRYESMIANLIPFTRSERSA